LIMRESVAVSSGAGFVDQRMIASQRREFVDPPQVMLTAGKWRVMRDAQHDRKAVIDASSATAVDSISRR
jgi:hypothetical protein